MDENGDSSWVFESRDVRRTEYHRWRSELTLAFKTCQPHRRQVSDVSGPGVDADSRMFWVRFAGIPQRPADVQIALYAYPVGWLALLIVSMLKFNISYVAPARMSSMLTQASFPSCSSRSCSTSQTCLASRTRTGTPRNDGPILPSRAGTSWASGSGGSEDSSSVAWSRTVWGGCCGRCACNRLRISRDRLGLGVHSRDDHYGQCM